MAPKPNPERPTNAEKYRALKWAKGGKYTARIGPNSILTIHCRPQEYTGLTHLLCVKFNLRKRLYKVWCSTHGDGVYHLTTIFKTQRCVRVSSHLFKRRTESLKGAVMVYLMHIHRDILREMRTQHMPFNSTL